MTGRAFIQVGARVRTNYETGPYIVKEVSAPCTCPEYLRSLDGDHRPSRSHHHLVVRREDGKRGDYFLNGFTLDGKSVWGRDRVLDASQMELAL